MTARRAALHLSRVLWAYFFVQAFAQFFVELPYGYLAGWIPCALALALNAWRSNDARRRRRALGDPAPVEVAPPVTGRWSALNSPADKQPSHGTHTYGQTYAIDILAEPDGGARPAPVWFWPPARRSEAFPAFGRPLLAVADATVLHAEDRQRDHLSRTSLPGVLYLLLVEGVARTLGGPRRIVGNHVVLDLGGGTYALYAHLRRGSLTVRTGDRVEEGRPLALCGNSGNSTEPHLHFQLMDDSDLDVARGLPFRWRGVGVPAAGEPFDVPAGGGTSGGVVGGAL
ncbi:M23 family metallopeptidase [Streptomyces candidus]|uniref:M23 family metallopeptidase n=1 Tax=Streptomyces candidus TaxID=67283 RepID=UPI001622A1C4